MELSKEEGLRNRRFASILMCAVSAVFVIIAVSLSFIYEEGIGNPLILLSVLLFFFFVSLGLSVYSHKKLNDYRVSHLKAGVPRSSKSIETNVIYRLLGKGYFSNLGLCVALAPIKNRDAGNMSEPFFAISGESYDWNSLIIKDFEKNQLFMLLPDDDMGHVIEDNIVNLNGQIYSKRDPTLSIANDYGGWPYSLQCREDGTFSFGDEEIKLFFTRIEPSKEQDEKRKDNQKEEEFRS